MIPRFDFGHFFKFLASVGLALMVAAVAVPWLFATTNGALTITQNDLSELTPVAQDVLNGRQQATQTVQVWLPLICVTLALLGIILFIWGLVGWRKRQKVSDDAEDVDLRTKSATYEKLTSGEADEKRREEVEEEVLEESRVVATPLIVDAEQKESTSAPQPDRQPDIRDRMRERRETEAHVASLLRAGLSDDLALTEGVKVTTPSGLEARIDFLLESSRNGTPWGQLAIELRFSSPRTLSTSIPGWMVSLASASSNLAQKKVYTGLRGRPADATTSGVLLLVLRDYDSADGRALERAKKLVTDVNHVLIVPTGVVVISEKEMAALTPERLRALVADAWNTGGQATLSPGL